MADDDSQANHRWIRQAVIDYEDRLMAYAGRLLADVDRARDVVQETFLRLCRQDRRQVEGHLAEWLFTVCRNRALDEKRKESRMARMRELDVHSTCQAPSPPEVAEHKETCDRVLKTITRLPENQQEVIRLKFHAGLSYREISGVTGLSVSNVGFLLHTGLKTIRGLLAESQPYAANS